MKIAVYPGSFDPITLGHLNIIKRAATIFDKVYVCVMKNSDKHPLFTREERMELIKRTIQNISNVEVDMSDELAVKYAKECIQFSENSTLLPGIAHENTLFGLCFAAPDQGEGMAAFLEKRKPVFKKGFENT